MIYKDKDGYPISCNDGMDSCVRNSILYRAGKVSMKPNLYMTWFGGVRHPIEVPANNFWNFTSDQMIMLIAMLKHGCYTLELKKLFWQQVLRGPFAQNFQRDYVGTWKKPWPHKMTGGDPKDEGKWRMFDFADITSPSRWGALIIGAEFKGFYWMLPFCRWVHNLNIKHTAEQDAKLPLDQELEMNQLIAECEIYGTLWFFNFQVKNWELRDATYWHNRGEEEYHEMNVQIVQKGARGVTV